ncbi:MAG: hypothetical protein U1B84_15060, partial [Variovorax sp.]|nr:hypothetical protein [Variovorax sp.]
MVITDDERAQLTSFARSRSLPASLSARARIVLSSAEGEANSSIAERLELGKATERTLQWVEPLAGLVCSVVL